MFNVAVTGSAALNYQWQLNGGNLSDGQSDRRIGGHGFWFCNGLLLTLSSVDGPSAGTYTVVITNSVSTNTSRNAVLVVSPYPSSQPQFTTSGSAPLVIPSSGNVTLSYLGSAGTTLSTLGEY